jgi:hypothetical protein
MSRSSSSYDRNCSYNFGFGFAATHSHSAKCLPPHTILYVYTNPVQKECVLLKNSKGVPVNASTGLPFK